MRNSAVVFNDSVDCGLTRIVAEPSWRVKSSFISLTKRALLGLPVLVAVPCDQGLGLDLAPIGELDSQPMRSVNGTKRSDERVFADQKAGACTERLAVLVQPLDEGNRGDGMGINFRRRRQGFFFGGIGGTFGRDNFKSKFARKLSIHSRRKGPQARRTVFQERDGPISAKLRLCRGIVKTGHHRKLPLRSLDRSLAMMRSSECFPFEIDDDLTVLRNIEFGARIQDHIAATFLGSESEYSLTAKFLVRPGRFHLLFEPSQSLPVPRR
jgi:hypothetical protein